MIIIAVVVAAAAAAPAAAAVAVLVGCTNNTVLKTVPEHMLDVGRGQMGKGGGEGILGHFLCCLRTAKTSRARLLPNPKTLYLRLQQGEVREDPVLIGAILSIGPLHGSTAWFPFSRNHNRTSKTYPEY